MPFRLSPCIFMLLWFLTSLNHHHINFCNLYLAWYLSIFPEIYKIFLVIRKKNVIIFIVFKHAPYAINSTDLINEP